MGNSWMTIFIKALLLTQYHAVGIVVAPLHIDTGSNHVATEGDPTRQPAAKVEKMASAVGLFQLLRDFPEAGNLVNNEENENAVRADDDMVPLNGTYAYLMALTIMVSIVAAMFYPMGISVICQVVIYVCCLGFVKISMKAIFAYGFNYPKFVTALHLLISSAAAFAVVLYRRINSGKPIVVPTRAELLTGILPIALTFGISIGAENSALVFVSAAFSEVVASSNPVMSAFLTWACGMTFHMQLLGPIAVVCIGCVISIQGELYFSSMGLVLLLFSVVLRGLKAVMQQKLMTGETKDRFDPVTLMAWTCLFSFVELAGYSLYSEGLAPELAFATSSQSSALLASIGVSCLIAVTLNISALFVIRQLGAVGMQMVSQMKAMLVVIGGVMLLSESFTFTQQLGFGTVLTGVWWYSSMKRELEPDAKGH